MSPQSTSGRLTVALRDFMTRSQTLGVVVAIALVNSSSAAASSEATTVFRIASPSVVTVHAFDSVGQIKSQGSGVVVSRELIVSNCHVTERASRIEVGYRGRRFVAKAHHVDRERDICSLSVKALIAPAAKLGRSDELEIGQSVFAIGAPQGLELSLSSGILSSLREIKGGRLIQTTAPISPGSSGGGLFDESGRLIGITTLYFTVGQQLNFAVPVEWVTELSERHAISQASLDDIELAKQGLNDLEEELRASSPVMYGKIRARLVEELPGIFASRPSSEWVSAARAHYHRLVDEDRAAGQEREEAVREATAALNELGEELKAKNPEMYVVLYEKLVAEAKRITSTLPPEQWVQATRSSYEQLSKELEYDERWVVLGSSDGSNTRLDSETVSRIGQRAEAWVRVDFQAPSAVAGVSNVSKYLARHEIDCGRRTGFVSSVTFYSSSGAVIQSLDITNEQRRTLSNDQILPGSVGEGVMELLCE